MKCLTYADLILPGFIFIMGAAIPLALERRIREGTSRFYLIGHILTRSFLLFWVGTVVTVVRYRGDLTGVPVEWWKLLTFLAAVGLLAPRFPVWSSRGRHSLRFLQIACLIFLVWASMTLRAGGHGGTILTGGGSAKNPQVPPTILGNLAWIYLEVSLLWLATRRFRIGRLAIYGLLLLFDAHFQLSGAILSPYKVWLMPWRFGRMGSNPKIPQPNPE